MEACVKEFVAACRSAMAVAYRIETAYVINPFPLYMDLFCEDRHQMVETDLQKLEANPSEKQYRDVMSGLRDNLEGAFYFLEGRKKMEKTNEFLFVREYEEENIKSQIKSLKQWELESVKCLLPNASNQGKRLFCIFYDDEK